MPEDEVEATLSEEQASPETTEDAPSEVVADTVPEPAADASEPAAETPSEATAETAEPADGAVQGAEPAAGAAEGAEPAGDAAPAASGPVEVGAIVTGTVQRITPYGAFIQLDGGKLGLIHISEIDRNYVKDVREHLREADSVQAKVLAIKDDGKIDLSIKALQDPQPRVERRRGSDPGFEQMLRKFMRQSEERQVDVKRSVMHKRK